MTGEDGVKLSWGDTIVYSGAIGGPVLLVLALIPGIWTWGPAIERAWWPVIENQPYDLSFVPEGPDRQRLQFYQTGVKLRPCRLETTAASWWVGDALVLPTVVVNAEGQTYQPVLSREIGPFRVGPHYAILPLAVTNTALDVELRINLYHRCHPFWLTESTIIVPVGNIADYPK